MCWADNYPHWVVDLRKFELQYQPIMRGQDWLVTHQSQTRKLKIDLWWVGSRRCRKTTMLFLVYKLSDRCLFKGILPTFLSTWWQVGVSCCPGVSSILDSTYIVKMFKNIVVISNCFCLVQKVSTGNPTKKYSSPITGQKVTNSWHQPVAQVPHVITLSVLQLKHLDDPQLGLLIQ